MKPNYCMCLSNALYLLQRPRHPSPRVACGSIDFHDGACAPKIGGAVPTVCCTCFSLGGCSVDGGGRQRKRVRRRFGHGERSLTRPLPRSSFPMWLCLFSSPPSPPQKRRLTRYLKREAERGGGGEVECSLDRWKWGRREGGGKWGICGQMDFSFPPSLPSPEASPEKTRGSGHLIVDRASKQQHSPFDLPHVHRVKSLW